MLTRFLPFFHIAHNDDNSDDDNSDDDNDDENNNDDNDDNNDDNNDNKKTDDEKDKNKDCVKMMKLPSDDDELDQDDDERQAMLENGNGSSAVGSKTHGGKSPASTTIGEVCGMMGGSSSQSRRPHWIGGTTAIVAVAVILYFGTGWGERHSIQEWESHMANFPDVKTEPEPESETFEPKVQETASPVSPSWSPTKAPQRAITLEDYKAMDWGHWTFWDSGADFRPKEDYCAKFPNRDVPADELPELAWQQDAVYVNHYLDAAGDLMERAKSLLQAEYGARSQMFHVHILQDDENAQREAAQQDGGWTTSASLDAWSRKLLHAMTANDSLTFLLVGNAAAAGHGNNFQQSYMMQLHAFLKPIFERLGVELVVRNMAVESALQGALAISTLLGEVDAETGKGGVDVLVLDFENEEQEKWMELAVRQALLNSPQRLPVVWGRHVQVLQRLEESLGLSVAYLGSAWSEMPATTSVEQAASLPWPLRFLDCPQDQEWCQAEQFDVTCWVDRDDGLKPPTEPQEFTLAPQDEWRGFRWHLLQSRVLAAHVLLGFASAVAEWGGISRMNGFPLDDETWHVTKMYEEIRAKVQDAGSCPQQLESFLPTRLCVVPLRAKTQHSPRANPEGDALLSLLQGEGDVPVNAESMWYDKPDVPFGGITDEQLDSVEILGRGPDDGRRRRRRRLVSSRRRLETMKFSDWKIDEEFPGHCDGMAESLPCGRLASSSCVLYGHEDSPGQLVGRGWFVVEVPQIEHGIVMMQLQVEFGTDEQEDEKEKKEEEKKDKDGNEDDDDKDKDGDGKDKEKDGDDKDKEKDGDDKDKDKDGGDDKDKDKDDDGKDKDKDGDGKGKGDDKEDDGGESGKEEKDKDNGKKGGKDKAEERRRRLQEDVAKLYEEKLPDSFQLEFVVGDRDKETWDKTQFLEQLAKVPQSSFSFLGLVTLLDEESFKAEEPVPVAIQIANCDECQLAVSHVYWA